MRRAVHAVGLAFASMALGASGCGVEGVGTGGPVTGSAAVATGAALTGLPGIPDGVALTADEWGRTTDPAVIVEALGKNRSPELAPPIRTSATRGEEIAIGLDIVDPEADVLRVSVTRLPPSAVYRPLTLTILWRPAPADGARGEFEVSIEEMLRVGATRTTAVRFGIDVQDGPVAPPASVPLADPLAASLVDFRDPARLSAVAAVAPLPRVLELVPALGPKLLGELASLHRNPLLDPKSPAFEKAWALEAWRLVAVRLRAAGPSPGVSLVYRAAAAEDAYLRIRLAAPTALVSGAGVAAPEGQLGAAAVALLARAYLMEGGAVRAAGPEGAKSAKSAAAGVAALVARALDPKSGFTVAGVDHGGRAGGGSARDLVDAYTSGDGWAFASYTPEGTLAPLRVVTSIVRRADGGGAKVWGPVCAPRYLEASPFYVAGVGPLCTGDGLVSLEREKVGSALVYETTATSASFRTLYAVRETPANDVRRIAFGETGMSCVACHTRDFDVGGAAARTLATRDARGAPVPRTFFAMTGPRPSAYLEALDTLEVCALRDALVALGEAPAFSCSLDAKE